MGKKRKRYAGIRAATKEGASSQPIHSQALGDEVKESRDLEFAAERKQVERVKRQKLVAERELEDARKEEKSLRAKLRSTRGAEARAAIKAQKSAATERRRQLQSAMDVRVASDGESDNSDEDEDGGMDARMREKIIKQTQEQRAEVEAEVTEPISSAAVKVSSILHDVGKPRDEVDDSDSDDGVDAGDRSVSLMGADEGDTMTEGDLTFLDGAEITEDDELALALFESARVGEEGNAPRGRTLGDIIMEKMREQEEERMRAEAIAADPERAAREKKIADVYGLVGQLLSRYRAGKLPKAFKIIPKSANWEDLMYYTRPDTWSPQASYQATRIFSSMKAREIERFYRDVLLPKCLDDIEENKKLNYHYFEALIKASGKPDAFNKGIIFPLCEMRACTMRQATVFSAILKKVSIPVLHSAAALLYMAQQPWSPANGMFVTAVLEKGYALPYRVVDSVVEYFACMKNDGRAPPVAWHRSLLVFAQKYKAELESHQKDRLKLLMRVHNHALESWVHDCYVLILLSLPGIRNECSENEIRGLR